MEMVSGAADAALHVADDLHVSDAADAILFRMSTSSRAARRDIAPIGPCNVKSTVRNA